MGLWVPHDTVHSQIDMGHTKPYVGARSRRAVGPQFVLDHINLKQAKFVLRFLKK